MIDMRYDMTSPETGGMGDAFSDFTRTLQVSLTPVVKQIVAEVRGPLMEVAQEAVELATPGLQKIVREEVMPKASLYIIIGMAAAGAVGALMAVTVLKR